MGDKEPTPAAAAPAAVVEDGGEGMQCSDHPYRTKQGGMCALCLQEKLGKLVSSSASSPFPPASQPSPSSASSSSPSFRSDHGNGTTSAASSGGPTRPKVPFLSTSAAAAKHGKKTSAAVSASSSSSHATLSRSKSVAPRLTGRRISDAAAADSPRKKSFWSFLYLSSSSSSSGNKRRSTSPATDGLNGVKGSVDPKPHQPELRQREAVEAAKATESSGNKEEEAAESPGGSQASSSSSFGRRVARSRSVGCGNRSFSGDFLERISTGFGDCTLRRVESTREPNKNSSNSNDKKMVLRRRDADEQRIRVKCGGLFSGFGMISSSSAYWLSAATAAEDEDSDTAKGPKSAVVRGRGGRSRSWAWAFASPMRAFRPAATTTTSKKSHATTANAITSINAAIADDRNGDEKKVAVTNNGDMGTNPAPSSSPLPVGG